MTASAIPAKKVRVKKNSQFLEVLKRLSKNSATIAELLEVQILRYMMLVGKIRDKTNIFSCRRIRINRVIYRI